MDSIWLNLQLLAINKRGQFSDVAISALLTRVTSKNQMLNSQSVTTTSNTPAMPNRVLHSLGMQRVDSLLESGKSLK